MNEEKQKEVIEAYLAAYNRFDVEGMIAQLHPQIVFQNVSDGEVNAEANGIEQFREMAVRSAAMFSSRHQQASEFSADGAVVSIEIAYEGILATNLPNGMQAGETLQLTGRSEFIFEDGKLIRITDFS
ncbi:MAG: nuclear transport factor 2 family protein [Cyanobacteria bacterium J06650_10]